MTPGQRRALLVVAAVVAVVALAAVALVVTGGDGDEDVATDTTSSSATTATTGRATTVPLRPVTTPPPGEPTTAGPSTTSAAAPEVSGEDAVLSRPATPASRSRPAGAACTSMALTGYSARCGEVQDGSETLVWMLERHSVTGGLRVSVLRPVSDRRYTVVLAAVDDGPAGPTRFSSVDIRSEDLSGDDTPELVFGFRNQGSGAILDLDVVDAPGRVVVHRSLDKGRAEVSAGRLDDWAAEFGPSDASCCPSRYRHGVIERTAGAWRLVSSRLVSPGDVPEGHFG